ncbi:hypothetical protein [Streptomyces sp. NPDC051704]|uniref:hypothetical protein n=1 Tax=Streptomyces sp. NPDC051704 TaxID=3365671 RepID=UPI0037999B69
MSDGIQWLVDQDDWQHGVVFARGIEPEELGVRMGGTPGSVVSPITDTEARNMVLDLATDEMTLCGSVPAMAGPLPLNTA